jgi:proline iminopeptidase
LLSWDRSADLGDITVPTLVIGARYDTMDPKHMEWMAGAVKNGRYLYCESGSHLAMYDDQRTYFTGLIDFIHSVNSNRL